MDAGCWGGVDSVSLNIPGIGIMSHSLAPEFMIQEIVMADTAGWPPQQRKTFRECQPHPFPTGPEPARTTVSWVAGGGYPWG